MVTAFFLVSCKKDVLDKKPLNLLTEEAVWTDQALIDAFLSSAYIKTPVLLNETSNRDNNVYYGEMFYINEIADEARAGFNRNWNWNFPIIKAGGLQINGGLLDYWNKGYGTIRLLNEFIERVPNSPVDTAFKRKRLAEARWLRAFNYFSLVKRYGGVPLITKIQSLEDPKESLFPKRNSEKEIYDFVIAELDAIANNLPESAYGRASKYSALALKSRAALYAGSIAQYGTVQLNGLLGFPAADAQAYYQKAYDAAKAIISSGKFKLYNVDADKVTNFKNMWLVEKNSEMIHVVPHDNVIHWNGGSSTNYDFQQSPVPTAWASHADAAYLEMAEEFEYADGRPGTLDRTLVMSKLWTMDELWGGRDPRFYATFWTNGSIVRGNEVKYHSGLVLPNGTIQRSGSYQGVLAAGPQYKYGGIGVYKFLNEKVSPFVDANTDTDWPVFRYAEILLNLAEAALELGKTTEALDAVNEIRNRAGIPALTSIDRDKIRHERKVELAFEGHRYWDLRRWRMAEQSLSRSFSAIEYYLDYTTRKFKVGIVPNADGTGMVPKFFSYNYYLPITLSRTAQNSNLVENPGYQ
jgi:hypothetical protein